MPQVNDLWPSASGRSNLGVDGGANAGAFDHTTLRPFGHVVFLSGILADPRTGQSGVLRFSQSAGAGTNLGLQFSKNGGASFQDIGFAGVDLQEAYDNGNEIDLATRVIGSLASHYGMMLRDVTPGSNPMNLDPLAGVAGRDVAGFGLAVSGANPEGSDFTYSITKLNSNGISIRGSGLPSTHPAGPSRPGSAFIGFSGYPSSQGTEEEAFSIATDAFLNVFSQSGQIFMTPAGNQTFNAANGIQTFVGNSQVFGAVTTFLAGAFGNADVQSGAALGLLGTTGLTTTSFGNTTFNTSLGTHTVNAAVEAHTIGGAELHVTGTSYIVFAGSEIFCIANNNNRVFFSASGTSQTGGGEGANVQFIARGDCQMHAFNDGSKAQNGNGSGIFHYEPFDQHRTWNIKTGHDPLGVENPIMHSGQILQLIENTLVGTLQDAYENGNSIDTSSFANEVTITRNQEQPHITFIGHEQYNITKQEGEVFYIGHSDIADTAVPNSQQGVNDASSLGYGNLGYNSGSGIVNLVTGSGIAEWTQTSASPLTVATTGTALTFATDRVHDNNYTRNGTGTTFTFMSPGIYLCSYTVGYTQTVGVRGTVTTESRLNGTFIPGSRTFCYTRLAVNGSSASCTHLIEANAGDTLQIFGTAQTATITLNGNVATLMLYKIGPTRTNNLR